MGFPSREALANLFLQGNVEYQKGDFAAAQRLYLKMLDAGVDSGPLYYNIGNACFKEKRLGEAIYYWEKARAAMPDDPDVRENLEFAGLMLVDRIEVPPDPYPVRIIRSLRDFLSVQQTCWVGLALFVLSNALFSAHLLGRSAQFCSRAFLACLITGLLAALMAGSLAWRIYDQGYRMEGIIVEQKADARSGPGSDNITVFTLHEGIKVRIRGQANGWYQVSLPNGWNGWLQQSSVRIL